MLAVDPLPSQHISFMLTAWVPAERSTRFYGEYVNGNRHTYQKTNDFHHCFTHIASPPFAREWSTAVNATASERYDTTNRGACQFLPIDIEDKSRLLTNAKRRDKLYIRGTLLLAVDPSLVDHIIYVDRLGSSRAVNTLLW